MNEGDPENTSAKSEGPTRKKTVQDEIESYAQSTIREMLGWYGLQDGGEPGGQSELAGRQGNEKIPVPAGHPSLDYHPPDVSMEPTHAEANPGASDGNHTDSINNGKDQQSHTVNGWDSRAPTIEQRSLEGQYSSPSSPLDSRRSGGNRKLIGMRYLFHPLGDNLSLLEKAKIWVARHDHKYFVGWTDEQLSKMDPVLKPIAPITSDMYKLHMNRSEYCRNVKLKYCLESESNWAQEFRDKLAMPMSKGGFSGLCQAKIAAAELWRKYSENYKSHQARYPNPKSKYRMRHLESENSLSLDGTNGVEEEQEEAELHEEEEDGLEKSWADMQEEMGICEEESKSSDKSDENMQLDLSGGENQIKENGKKDEEIECKENNDVIIKALQKPTINIEEDSSASGDRKKSIEIVTVSPDTIGEMSVTENRSDVQSSSSSEYKAPATDTIVPITITPNQFTPLYSNFQQIPKVMSMNMMSPSSPYPAVPPPVQDSNKKPLVFRPAEYKKSERGLSYLFPSLADQQLSLLDKVKITVMRHKSNYFLGWTEQEVLKVDPMVRPKMVVTKELYKEYCHRNAMKYDSNLQYAMESPEPWAVDFRERLSKPPSEGGFHSLCEVKQEAGRLWKEYSGKYKMHNVVKAQMDLNNEKSAYRRKGIRSKHRNMEKVIPPGIMMEKDRNQFSSRIRSASSSPGMEELHSPSSLAASPNSAMSHNSGPTRSSRSADSSPLSMHPRPQSQFSPGVVGLTQRDPLNYSFTPSSSPYNSATDLSITGDENRKRRYTEDGYVCSSNGSSPRVMEDRAELPWKQPRLTQEVEDQRGTDGELPPVSSTGSQQAVPWRPLNTTAFGPATNLVSQQRDTTLDQPQTVDQPPESNSAEDIPEGIDSVDTLFLPLPSHLSVAQQLSIWLERHANNYFLRLPKEQLLSIDPLLRPHIPVTDETYRRFISESMVCMFDRVGKIMTSTTPWAKDFQEKVHKKPQEGGSLTVEEALTEAIDLWKQHVELGEERSQVICSEDGLATDYVCEATTCCGMASYVDTIQSQPVPAHHPTSGIPLKVEPDTRAAPQEHFQRPESTTTDLSQALDLTISPQGATVDEGSCPKPSKCASRGQHGEQPLQQIVWQCRERLHNFCRDDPTSSWQDRLRPYLGVLREKLGESYTCPKRVSDCMVDLLLAVVHEELSCI